MISYYDLLGMINDGEAPRRIKVYLAGHPREYEAIYDMDEFSYYSLIGEPDDDYRYYLAESYVESCMFDDNIEIVEEDKKIERLETYEALTNRGNLHTYMNIDGSKYEVSIVQQKIIKELNKIIDKVNNMTNCTK